MQVDLPSALKAVDDLGGYQRELLASLVSAPSVRAEPTDVHELCAAELERAGMAVDSITPRVDELERHPEWSPPDPAVGVAEPGRLVSVVGSAGEGPGILLFAHIDTERPDPREDWETDPYQATEVGGRVYGVGTADDKAGVVSVLAAARALVPRLRGVRLVVGLVHGKLGGGLGTLPAMAGVGEVDSAVYCHPAETGKGMTHFKIASRGFFGFRVETEGRRPDPVEIRTPLSEDPRQGINAFGRLRGVLEEVDRWADREGVLCSVNRVSAGTDPVVLPERAVAEGAVWFRRGTVTEVCESLKAAALRAGAGSIQMFGMRSNPAEIPADHPLVAATTTAIALETGVTPGLYPAHVASDIRFPIRCLNAPTVGFGALGGNFYGPNEWVDTADLHRATRVLVRIASAWAEQAGGGTPWPPLGG
ncbi:MAG: M20/M25/M40 family metallo-hydrolase [bacterium]|nr:M20/M25/M40 family metallo-hydrolase [bacterium]